MNKLISLVNVFALLSLLAVGGGTAVLPQMKHEVVGTHQWLTAEQFTRDLGGSFPSVRDTLVHIIGGEWGWLAYWKEPSRTSAFLEDLWARHDALFHPDAFLDLATVQLKWEEIAKEQADFVGGLTNESLEEMLPLRKIQVPLAQLMQHMANHSTYHRGQVSIMMRQLGGKPVATDFARFLLVGRSEAAHAR